MALMITSTSPILALSNKSSHNSSKMTLLGTQSLAFRGITLSKTRSSFTVRAELEEGGLSREMSHVDPPMRRELSHIDPLLPFHLNKRAAMIDNSPYMRTPWNTTEDENEIRMWFDVPGLSAPELDVNVVDNLLIIKGTEGVDAFGKKIHSPFDCKLQLPHNCAKEETQAVIKNGVLYISVPKITKAEHMKFIHVPVRPI